MRVFLASVIATTKQRRRELAKIPIICDLVDVFPDKVLRLLPTREVEFVIDLVLKMTPIFRALYRMAVLELRELKEQL